MQKSNFELASDITASEVFGEVCAKANGVIEDLDEVRRSEYGRGYYGSKHFTEIVPGTAIRLAYIPLPGSSAQTTVEHADSGYQILRVSSDYTLDEGKILPCLDRGIVSCSFIGSKNKYPADFSLSSGASGKISLRAPKRRIVIEGNVEVDSMNRADSEILYLVTRALHTSIKATERIRDGAGFWSVARMRKQEFIHGI